LEGLANNENVVHFVGIWSILRPFAIFNGHWYISWKVGIFFSFWYVAPREIWHPWSSALAGKGNFNWEKKMGKLDPKTFLLSFIFLNFTITIDGKSTIRALFHIPYNLAGIRTHDLLFRMWRR
jgi:hypothetical protein